MTLQNNLYELVSVDAGAAEANFAVRLLPDCHIYKAHFPGMPITPGVCIVEMVKELLEIAVGRNLRIKFLKNAKFLTALPPVSTYIRVSISKISTMGDAVTAQARIYSEDAVVYARISMQAEIA